MNQVNVLLHPGARKTSLTMTQYDLKTLITYDRNADGDFDITDHTSQVASLYQRKQASYSENRVFPHPGLDDLDRYDDGDFVDVNLVKSYERIMEFIHKHLPDPFYLEGTTSISIRDAIFREVASNLLIHREYTNAYPAKLIIEYGQVRTENSSRPHGFGQLDPKNFTPFPKNPVIARFFRQIGLADELGSGMRKMMKYSQAYGGSNPELVEGDVFRIRIQVPEFSRQMLSEAPVEAPVEATPEVTPEVAREVNPEVMRLLKLVVGEMSRHELQIRMGLKDSEHFRKSYLMPALASGLMEMTNPDKPRSSRQRYRVTAKGKSQVLLSKTGEENE